MDSSIIAEIMNELVMNAFYICGPILSVAMLVGIVIGILQSVTQIKEMTLTFVPKMIAIVVLVSLAGWWMLDLLVVFTEKMFGLIPDITK